MMGGSESKEPSQVRRIPTCAKLVFQATSDEASTSQDYLERGEQLLDIISSAVALLDSPVRLVEVVAALFRVKGIGDSIVVFLKNENGAELQKAMIDSRISSALVNFATSQLRTEMAVIEVGRGRMFRRDLDNDAKRREVSSTFKSCLRVRSWFSDKEYPFWGHVIPSSEYLLRFATLHLETMLLCVCFDPTYRDNVTSELSAMKRLLKQYKEKCLDERIKQTWSGAQAIPCSDGETYYSFEDKWGTPWEMTIDITPRMTFNNDDLVRAGKEAFQRYRDNTRALYGAEFDRVIERTEQFLENVRRMR